MENPAALAPLQVLWDYLCLNTEPRQADCIVGFGNFNDNIARRAAELYHRGYAPKILFTGGQGRNTLGILKETEADRFARVAIECGVPDADIIREDKATNTKENIDFTRALLQKLGIPQDRILVVHQPTVERRIRATLMLYWPEPDYSITSPRITIPQYLSDAKIQGLTEEAAISSVVGDFQRMDLYAKRGMQLPEFIPPEAWDAFHTLVAMGYDSQLAK